MSCRSSGLGSSDNIQKVCYQCYQPCLSAKPHTRSSVDMDTKSPNSLFLANKRETYSKLLSCHHRPICFLHPYVIFNIILSVY